MALVSNKEHRLSVRVDAKLKKRLEQAEKDTGIDEATIVRQCIAAFCDHVEQNGRAVFPLAIGGDVGQIKPLNRQEPGDEDDSSKRRKTGT